MSQAEGAVFGFLFYFLFSFLSPNEAEEEDKGLGDDDREETRETTTTTTTTKELYDPGPTGFLFSGLKNLRGQSAFSALRRFLWAWGGMRVDEAKRLGRSSSGDVAMGCAGNTDGDGNDNDDNEGSW